MDARGRPRIFSLEQEEIIMRPFSWLAAALAAAIVAACSSHPDDAPAKRRPTAAPPGRRDAAKKSAVELFWSIYHGNDYMRISEAQNAIQAAIGKNPDDAELHGLLAATHFWHAGESGAIPTGYPSIERRFAGGRAALRAGGGARPQ